MFITEIIRNRDNLPKKKQKVILSINHHTAIRAVDMTVSILISTSQILDLTVYSDQ